MRGQSGQARVDAQPTRELLTPSAGDSDLFLTYSIEYPPFDGAFAALKVCNPTDMAIDDKKTHFDLLVIDAQ